MASVKPRNGKWQVRWREGTRARAQTFTDEKRARAFAIDVEQEKELGRRVVTRRDVPSVGTASKEWLAAQSGLSPNTEQLYANLLAVHILPDLGHLSLLDLTPRRLEEWQGKRLKKSGPRAVQMARGILKRTLNRAVAHGYLPMNPLQVVDHPRMPASKSLEVATVEQVEAIRGILADDKHYLPNGDALVSVLAYVGLRPPQEPCALKWGDLEGRTLHVRRKNAYGRLIETTKTKKARVVRLPAPIAAELSELRLKQKTGLIFPRPDGQPATKTDWDNWRNRRFKPAAQAVGLSKDFTPYDLRHTCASLMLAAHIPIPTIARQLGHTVHSCTSTYLHLVPAYEDGEKVDLEERIRAARKPAPDNIREIGQ